MCTLLKQNLYPAETELYPAETELYPADPNLLIHQLWPKKCFSLLSVLLSCTLPLITTALNQQPIK